MSQNLILARWFDWDMPAGTPPPAFDAAIMAAMNRPWPDIVFSSARVVPSGMAPSDTHPP